MTEDTHASLLEGEIRRVTLHLEKILKVLDDVLTLAPERDTLRDWNRITRDKRYEDVEEYLGEWQAALDAAQEAFLEVYKLRLTNHKEEEDNG